MERLTKHDSDIGYYVEEDMANQEATSNIDGRNVIQGEAITRLAELENMIEEGELVRVVRCKDCMDWGVVHPSNKSKKCNFWSSKEEHLYTVSEDFCSYGGRRK